MSGKHGGLTRADTDHPVYAALNEFFHHYLVKRDLQGTLELLSNQLYSVGTGEDEVAIGKAAFLSLLQAEFSQLPDPISYSMSDYVQKERVAGCWDCFCNLEMKLSLPNRTQALYHMRLTAGLHQEGARYIIDTLHASESSKYQEAGEFLPLKFISRALSSLNRETQYQLMELIGQIMPGGIVGGYMEEGFPLYVANNRLLGMGGYESYQDFASDIQGLVINSIHPDDREYVYAEMARILALGDQYEIQYRMKRKDGSYIWVHDMGRRTIAADGRDAIISVLMDISQQMSTKCRLEHEAATDPLTGIYNRKGGQEHIQKAMKSACSYSFFMLDLDHFKRVNDLYGHQEGDHVLCLVADQLTNLFPERAVVCRLGGDEFAVFVPDCESVSSIEQKLQTLLDTYQAMMNRGWPLAGSTLSVGGVYGRKHRTCLELYQLADEALYEVKNSRKGAFKLCILE